MGQEIKSSIPYKKFFLILALLLGIYGGGRLYYQVTGGFTESNIYYDRPFDPRFQIKANEDLSFLLSKKFNYLGKGCQSYVFEREGGDYVIKFFKYQRFRPQEWLKIFSFIPQVEEYRLSKIEKKKKKLESVFISWKIAYEELQKETGVVFVQLNKSSDLKETITLVDKVGFIHTLPIGNYEFLIQKKAKMLCPTLDAIMERGQLDEAKKLLDKLIALLISEYARGFADNDHALMQNTGVLDGEPVHIDVGQFVKTSKVKEAKVVHQELFNKTWKFRKWLEKKHPPLALHLVYLLKQQIGEEEFNKLKPHLNKAIMGVLSHEATF